MIRECAYGDRAGDGPPWQPGCDHVQVGGLRLQVTSVLILAPSS